MVPTPRFLVTLALVLGATLVAADDGPLARDLPEVAALRRILHDGDRLPAVLDDLRLEVREE